MVSWTMVGTVKSLEFYAPSLQNQHKSLKFNVDFFYLRLVLGSNCRGWTVLITWCLYTHGVHVCQDFAVVGFV